MNQNIAQQNGTQPKFREMGLAWVWVEYLELSINPSLEKWDWVGFGFRTSN